MFRCPSLLHSLPSLCCIILINDPETISAWPEVYKLAANQKPGQCARKSSATISLQYKDRQSLISVHSRRTFAGIFEAKPHANSELYSLYIIWTALPARTPVINTSTEHHPAGTTLKQSFVHLHFHPALIFLQKKNHLQNILQN